VPEDAWIDWNSEEQRWITVGETHPEGLTTRTKVTVRFEDGYLERTWHDGTQVSLADVVIPWILSFDRADPDSRLYDAASARVFEIFQRHFRGRRIVSTEPLIVEIYSDQIFPDAETMVSARAPSASAWHTLALGILAERQGELAFSSNKADRNQIEWMNLVSGPSLSVLARHLERARAESFVPYANAVAGFLREGEAAARYEALDAWFQQRRHFWVSDGPFYLHAVYPVERSVVLRRFEDFPDPADKWLRFAEPRVPVLDLDGPMVVQLGEAAEFSLDISFGGDSL
jgi:peptide/nickel transport system substrate-binding protein